MEIFSSNRGQAGAAHNDINYEVVLGNCNRNLTQWMDTWEFEMKRGTYTRATVICDYSSLYCSER